MMMISHTLSSDTREEHSHLRIETQMPCPFLFVGVQILLTPSS